MMGAPKTNAPKSKIVSQSLEFSSITANTAITIERPIKRPATQLPAFRHLTRGLFMIHSDPGNDGRKPEGSRCAGALTAK
jgi:hypothetical protein